jgi:hypothetical protein
MSPLFITPEDDLPEELFIVDDSGKTPISKDYRDMGVSEGWLAYHGENSDDKKISVLYIHCHSPP